MASGDTVDWDEYERIAAERERAKSAFDDKALAEALKNKVIGQDRAADQISKQLKHRLAQVKLSKGKTEKPLGVFLLAGPPGVGKSHFSKVLADNLFGGKGKNLIHFEMNQFAQNHSISGLIGSPPGYTGGSGKLTNALLQNPRSVVLLDEFEKAHTDVHKIFLTAWNDGFITDAHTGKKVPTTQALFMVTTNAVWETLLEIERSSKGDIASRDSAVEEALRQGGYVPEVLSRIDYIFVFEPLDSRGLARVANLEILSLAGRFALKVTKVDPGYLFDTVSQERFQGVGIRQLARVLESQLSDQFLDAQQSGANSVEVAYDEGQPVVRAVMEPPPAAQP